MTAHAIAAPRALRSIGVVRRRAIGLLGRLSMYRLVLGSLAIVIAIAGVASLAGAVTPTPVELAASLLVLVLVGAFVDVVAQHLLRLPQRLAAALAARGALWLTLRERHDVTPTVRELTFEVRTRVRIEAGQHLELEVPHARQDARGTRRAFSVVSAPEDLPLVRIAYREPAVRSSFKRALGARMHGDRLRATGVWGDFVLPRDAREPVLLVAGGIGVTPFVAQLRHLERSGQERDVRLVLVASSAAEVPYLEELAATGVPTLLCTPDRPTGLPRHWRWSAARLDARLLTAAIPDLEQRRAYVSGPPGMLAELTPILRTAKSLRTDAFAGY